MRQYGPTRWMSPACPGEPHVPNYTTPPSQYPFSRDGEAVAGKREWQRSRSCVATSATIPRASRGASSNAKVNADDQESHLVLAAKNTCCLPSGTSSRPAGSTFCQDSSSPTGEVLQGTFQDSRRTGQGMKPATHPIGVLKDESVFDVAPGKPRWATPLSIFLFVVPHLCGLHHRQAA